ncbi:MAG: DUF6455 family protein [Pseudomonadota bacterium]
MKHSDLEDRLALTRAMAARAGLDLETETGVEKARRMAERCAGCVQTETCRLALIAGGGDNVPGYCLNRETIEALAARR